VLFTQQSGHARDKVNRRSLVFTRLFPSWPSPQLDGNPCAMARVVSQSTFQASAATLGGSSPPDLDEYGLGNL